MNAFLRTEEFDAWLIALKDKMGRARIVHRIRSAEHGNFGDCEPVGEGVAEMRVGGDKSSQKRDVKRAIDMARALDKE
jgi:putative component of toxin-antitoxin plasmid stabilization module